MPPRSRGPRTRAGGRAKITLAYRCKNRGEDKKIPYPSGRPKGARFTRLIHKSPSHGGTINSRSFLEPHPSREGIATLHRIFHLNQIDCKSGFNPNLPSRLDPICSFIHSAVPSWDRRASRVAQGNRRRSEQREREDPRLRKMSLGHRRLFQTACSLKSALRKSIRRVR